MNRRKVTAQSVLEDACVCACIDITPDDPRKMLNDVISWHVAVALDPAVSSDARRLWDSGRAEMLAELLSGEVANG